MEDKFEKFVTENREAFEFHEPDPKIWNRIESNLRFKNKPGWRHILQRVAVVAVIFAASYVVNEMVHRYTHGELKADHAATKSNGKNPALAAAPVILTTLTGPPTSSIEAFPANKVLKNPPVALTITQVSLNP